MTGDEHVQKANSDIDLIKYLYKESIFMDWCIYACYIASYHLFEAAIFQKTKCSISGKTFEFRHLNDIYIKLRSAFTNEYFLLSQIVRENFSEVHGPYRTLSNIRNQARYGSCQIKKSAEATLYINSLNQIIDFIAKEYPNFSIQKIDPKSHSR